MIYTGDSFGRAAGRRFIIDTGADDYDEDYEHGHEHDMDEDESDSHSDAAAYPVEEEDEDDDDADSLYSSGQGRRESGGGTRSPPLLQPSKAINRLSAIIHPYHPQHPNNSRPITPKDIVTSTTPIPRPRFAHSHEPLRCNNQPQHVVIEEVEEGGEPASITISNTAKASITVSTKEVPTITTTTAIARGTGTQETTIATQETENEPEPGPEVKKSDLVYKVADISAAIKQRKEMRARNRAYGVPGTGASKISDKTTKSKRWSIATSITGTVGGAVPVSSKKDEGPAVAGRNRSVSVSSATPSIRSGKNLGPTVKSVNING